MVQISVKIRKLFFSEQTSLRRSKLKPNKMEGSEILVKSDFLINLTRLKNDFHASYQFYH